MSATLATDKLQGDELGAVDVRFSVAALQEFIAMLNMNTIRNAFGNRLTFRVVEWHPGKALFEATEHVDETP